ncbi:MAG: integrase [Deltaproteobacteria bacterium CG_4_9_14_3_um_filter_51_14]|nr:site-specific integrase [bacterium]PJB38940.1 MAG: integrase [Deltaproteobacteria bacterium CG_4_9_14_3_um_filter_51_14]
MGTNKLEPTKFPGVLARKHPTRKHGLGPDLYYVIYHRFNGRNCQEAIGWASQGWTAAKARDLLSELRENQRRGEPPFTLKEKRQQAITTVETEHKAAVTFQEIFIKNYLPHAKTERKSWKPDDILFRLWIQPSIGTKPLAEISPFDIERIKGVMSKAGKSARTILYCLSVIRQVFNFAIRRGLFTGKNPVSLVKKPSMDNRRLRFLTEEEAATLLEALRERSEQTYQMALMSLNTGARFSEIAGLRFGDVDLQGGTLTFWDTKNGQSRVVFMTDQVKEVFSKKQGERNQLVFPARTGGRMASISKVFDRTVAELGLNKGITDRRQKLVFHSLRHTAASWLVQRGVDLLTVAAILGHKSIKMCERYSHLSPDGIKRAMRRLDGALVGEEGKVVNLNSREA